MTSSDYELLIGQRQSSSQSSWVLSPRPANEQNHYKSQTRNEETIQEIPAKLSFNITMM